MAERQDLTLFAVGSPAPVREVHVVPEPLEMIDAEECGIERFREQRVAQFKMVRPTVRVHCFDGEIHRGGSCTSFVGKLNKIGSWSGKCAGD